jgi:membrane protease YdiL (CAAX protease family)
LAANALTGDREMQKMNAQIFWSIIYAVIGGLIFILGLNLLKLIPVKFQDSYKIGLPIILLIVYFASQKYFPDQKAVFLAFFLVSVGWMLDFYLTGKIKDIFSFNTKELSGLAYTMVISTLMVSAPVIIGWLISGQNLSVLFIQVSVKMWGIIPGIAGLLLFGGLGVLQSLDQGLAIKEIGVAIPLALVFSLANGFREELVYRAALIKGFQAKIGVFATIIVTTLVFTLAHIDVSYTPASQIVFIIVLVIIGVVGSLIMMKTGSLLGSVLFHAGADILLIMGMLSSQQLMMK